MIIHIKGVSGSGKSTLGNKLQKAIKNSVVIDTDDIDDKNAVDIIGNKKYNSYFCEKKINKFFDLRAKMNFNDVKKIIKQCEDNNKILIFVGLSFYGKADPINYANYKYFIDIDPEDNFRFATSRNIGDICRECKNLKSLMKKETNPYKIQMLILHKYKIRGGFRQMNQIVNNINFFKEKAKNEKYKLMSSDDIYYDIIDKIKHK
jgi:uridine kinase